MISKNQVNKINIFTGKNALFLKSISSILYRAQWNDQNVRTMRIRKYSIFTQKVKIF